MSLTITIDRTEAGRCRAEVADHPRLVLEHDEHRELVAEPEPNLDRIAVMPAGRLLLVPARVHSGADEATVRAEVERTAMRNEKLDKLIDPYPVPVGWGKEPGSSGAR